MDLKVPIAITDELTEDVVQATGLLDLASGDIQRVEYTDWDVETQGLPWQGKDYEFSSGTLSNNGKDVEFRVDINRATGQYSVSANELLEIKVRAAQLFAGMSGKDLALRGINDPKPAPAAKAAAKSAGGVPPKGRGGSRYH